MIGIKGKNGAAKHPAPAQAKSATKVEGSAQGKAADKPASDRTGPYAEDVVATRLLRDIYTRERHYFLMRIIIIMSVVLVISVSSNVYLATQPPQFRYFATDTEGKIKELTALARPIQSLNEILNWTTNAVTQSYTFNFANYRQELQAARNNFTEGGWRGFEKALTESNNLKIVLESRYVATAVPTGAPVIVSQGLVEGRYAWKIQLPILVTYQNLNGRTTQDLMVTAVVVRRPETEHPKGLGIAQFIAE